MSLHFVPMISLMKTRIAIVMSVLLATLSLSAVEGSMADSTRPAVKQDIPGMWEMFYQHVSNVNNKSPQDLLQYQVFEFGEDGGLKVITATKRVSQEDRKLLLRIMPEGTTWESPREGLLVVRRSELDADGIDAYLVTAPYQDAFISGSPSLQPGDLVLVYFDELRQPYLRRYLRPIEPEPEPDPQAKKPQPPRQAPKPKAQPGAQ